MKAAFYFSFLLFTLSGIISCKETTTDKLARKWDCIKVENLDKVDKRYETAEDSLAMATLSASLEALTWTFRKNNEYECAVGSRITTRGTYEVDDESQTIICTSNTKNNNNRYSIVTLTENQLVLSTNAGNVNLLMHFSPH